MCGGELQTLSFLFKSATFYLKFPVFYTAFMKPMTLLLIAISLRAKKMYINISALYCEKSFCNILKSLHYFRPIFTGKMIILYK